MVTGSANGVANGAANGSAAKEQVGWLDVLIYHLASPKSRPCSSCRAPQVFLVFGKSGWIGGLLGQLLKERGLKFEYANARLEERAEVIADLERVSPNLIGVDCVQRQSP